METNLSGSGGTERKGVFEDVVKVSKQVIYENDEKCESTSDTETSTEDSLPNKRQKGSHVHRPVAIGGFERAP